MKQNTAVALKLLEQSAPPGAAPGEEPPRTGQVLLGLCCGGAHPTLPGRVLARWRTTAGATEEAWLPQLQGVNAREGDHVMLIAPDNHDEQIVAGILDGIAGNVDTAAAESGPLLRLQSGELLRVAGPDGQPLLEIKPTEAGPEVRLLAPPAALSFPGSFRVSADQLEFEARQGEVRIAAAGDVKVSGEIIRLN